MIEKMILENFMGFNGIHSFDMSESMLALIGKNGTGKTSLINAFRYILSGDETGDIVAAGQKYCIVTAVITGKRYKKKKILGNPDGSSKTTCFINEKKVTLATFSHEISDTFMASEETLRLVSSSEVIAAMKPQDFGDYILTYCPQNLTTDILISHVDNPTSVMQDIIRKNFPNGTFSIEAVDNFYNMCYEIRAALKKTVHEEEINLKDAPEQAPDCDVDELQEKLKAATEKLNVEKVFAVEKKVYDDAIAALNKYTANLNDLKKQYAELKVREPDANVESLLKEKLVNLEKDIGQKEKEEKALNNKLNNVRENFQNAKHVYQTLENNLVTFMAAKENISKPVCPMSEKLKCTVDKTPILNEIEKSITGVNDAMETQRKKLLDLKAQIESVHADLDKCCIEKNGFKKEETDIRKQIDEMVHQAKLWADKQAIYKQAETLSQNKPIVPSKPHEPDMTNVYSEIQSIQEMLAEVERFSKAQELRQKFVSDQQLLIAYERLCELFSPRGTVKAEIIKSFIGSFESIMNMRIKQILPEFSVKLIFNKGVHVMVGDNGNDLRHFTSLSGGEKACVLFAIIDAINAVSNARILVMDELSVLDPDVFSSFIRILVEQKNNYEHIIIAAVNHDSIIRTIDGNGIKRLTIL